MERILWTGLFVAIIFCITMALMLRRKWRKGEKWKKAHPTVNEMIERNKKKNEAYEKFIDWKDPRGNPDGKEAR